MDDRLHKVHLPFPYVVYPCTCSTIEEVNTKSFNGNLLKAIKILSYPNGKDAFNAY